MKLEQIVNLFSGSEREVVFRADIAVRVREVTATGHAQIVRVILGNVILPYADRETWPTLMPNQELRVLVRGGKAPFVDRSNTITVHGELATPSEISAEHLEVRR